MNYWNNTGIPHKGWTLINIYDIREHGRPTYGTNYESCMMCNNEKIRFVHVLSHPEVSTVFHVGCICAERMTSDYLNPKKRETELRNRALRRMNWSKKAWKRSKNGNYFTSVEGRNITIYIDGRTKKFKCKVDTTFGEKYFETLEEAKTATFNGIEHLKKNGLWQKLIMILECPSPRPE